MTRILLRGAIALVPVLLLAGCSRGPGADETFRLACNQLRTQTVPEIPHLVHGRAGWVYHVSELAYAGAGKFWGEAAAAANPNAPAAVADPMPAILHFSRELEARGVELVFLPIPVRPAIYPEGVLETAEGAEPGDLMPAQTEMLARLRAQGVTAIDLTPRFLANRHHERGPLFVPSDTHWTPVGATLAARAVAEEISDRPWYDAIPKLEMSRRWVPHEHFGGHFRQLRDRAGVTDLVANPISLRKIKLRTESGPERLELRNPGAPVVVIGDSNTIWWRQLSAAFPYQLAAELGFTVDVLSTTGGGANETRLNLRRMLQAEPSYLEGTRAVVWCFSARSFTNTREGWLEIGL